MSTASSNAHAVSIIAAVSSVLGQKLASMAPDSWSTITVGNILPLDPAGTTDGWLSQSPRGEWDSLHNIGRTWGGNHGNSALLQRYWMSGYDDASNLYTGPVAVAGGLSTQITHGFYSGPAVDQQTGDVYGTISYIDNSDVRRYSYATAAWDTPFPSNGTIGAHCSGIAVAYHPGLYGGAGGLLCGSNSGIWSSPLPRSGTPSWTIILDRTNAVDAMGDFPVCTYNRKDGCVYMGGGSGSQNLWKIPASSAAGSPVQIANAPVTIYEWTSNSEAFTLTGPGNSANSLVAIGSTGQIYVYNESANTWSLSPWTVPSSILNGSTANKWWNVIACPAYGGGILVMQGNLSTSPQTGEVISTLNIWKH